MSQPGIKGVMHVWVKSPDKVALRWEKPRGVPAVRQPSCRGRQYPWRNVDQWITIGKRKDRVKQYSDTFAEVHIQRVSKIDVKDLQQGLGLLYAVYVHRKESPPQWEGITTTHKRKGIPNLAPKSRFLLSIVKKIFLVFHN